jgi:hypothetical protein
MKVRPIVLNIEQSIWLEFCKNVPETRTKNGTIVELIEKYNQGCKNANRLFISKE